MRQIKLPRPAGKIAARQWRAPDLMDTTAPAMRPELLNPLFAEVTGLKGVGAGLARPLDKLGLTRIRDLVYHWPDRFVARRVVARFDDAAIGENIVIAATVREHRASAGRGPYRVLVEDAAGDVVALVYFGRASYSARKLLPPGEQRWIAGRLDQFGQVRQIVHPDHVAADSAELAGTLAEPVYPLSEGLTQPRMAALVHQALALAPALPEWIEPGLLAQRGWPDWRAADPTARASLFIGAPRTGWRRARSAGLRRIAGQQPGAAAGAPGQPAAARVAAQWRRAFAGKA